MIIGFKESKILWVSTMYQCPLQALEKEGWNRSSVSLMGFMFRKTEIGTQADVINWEGKKCFGGKQILKGNKIE